MGCKFWGDLLAHLDIAYPTFDESRQHICIAGGRKNLSVMLRIPRRLRFCGILRGRNEENSRFCTDGVTVGLLLFRKVLFF